MEARFSEKATLLPTHIKNVFQVSSLRERLLYNFSIVQRPVTKQWKVHVKLLNISRRTSDQWNDNKNGACRHLFSSEHLMYYKTVRAREEILNQQKYCLTQPSQKSVLAKFATTERSKLEKDDYIWKQSKSYIQIKYNFEKNWVFWQFLILFMTVYWQQSTKKWEEV